MEVKRTIFLLVVTLLSYINCLDWMAAGTFTQDNMTIIRAKINAFSPDSSNSTFTAYATTMSTQLNTLWAEAWNVVIVYYEDFNNYDAVLYGYGFNGHWFWLSGFKLQSERYVSFIIWKDFNCVQWFSIDPSSASYQYTSYSTQNTNTMTNHMQGNRYQRDLSDIWLAAKDLQDKIPAINNFNDKLGFSIIATQALNSQFFAYICGKDYIVVPYVGNIGGYPKGKCIVIQMRAS